MKIRASGSTGWLLFGRGAVGTATVAEGRDGALDEGPPYAADVESGTATAVSPAGVDVSASEDGAAAGCEALPRFLPACFVSASD